MYLSRLDLHGFKSFAQKTAVEFAPGVTAIVGPNGCGKSNVIDAVRWVLGEQRARVLRSESMGGVLFNGAAGKRPLGMAEVALTVENTRGVLPTEYSTVTVTRRLFRNGDSEYLLNGTTCRLRDVQDLFMDTGMGSGAYSVIELSMVEDILSDNAADRRRLFEEAAGVTKYKRRREGALRRLAATEADLTRLDDILEEVEKQVRSLERQAQKAARHQRYADRLRLLELALAAHDLNALDAERAGLDGEARSRRDAAEAFAAQSAQGEARLEEARTTLVDLEGRMGETARALAAHAETVRSLDAELRVGAERQAADRRALERLDREAGQDAARASTLAADQDGVASRLTDALAAADATADALVAAQTARDEATAHAERIRTSREAARQADASAQSAARQAQAARDRASDRRALHAAEVARVEADRAALAAPPSDAAARQAAGEAETESETAQSAWEAARQTRDAARAALDTARGAASAASAARDAASAQVDLLRALVEAGEGVEGAVAALAAAPAMPATTVAELIACDEADRLALDAALGDWAHAVVVPTEAEADAAIAHLRASDAGRATFLVLKRLAPRPAPATPPGATPASDVARVSDPAAASLVPALLAGVFVVDTLGDARRLRDAHPAARFVARDGSWTDASGAVRGGSARPAAGRLGLGERQARADAALAAAAARLADAAAQRDAAQRAVADAEAALDAAQAVREASRDARDAARQALARVQAAASARDAQAARLDARVEELAEALAEAPDPAALEQAAVETASAAQAAAAARAAAEAAWEAADAARREADAAFSDARLAHARAQSEASARQADRDRLDAERRALVARQAERTTETARLTEAIAHADATRDTTQARLDAARVDSDALGTSASAAETDVLQARAAIADAEKALRAVRAQRDEAWEAASGLERRLTEIAVRQEALQARLADEYQADLDAADEAYERLTAEELFQPDTARVEVPRLRDKIRGLGAVNALALESYDEQAERLAFLQAQRADLQGAEDSLRETIREINETARRRFDETFGQIREAFQRLFAELFGGDAAADVTLDEGDPLEAPVQITARPRGKRPVSITQLSGGEKTLTATALLFAIYLVKPSPFCILDEVDAPLDDANVARFMRLIHSFSDRTQFILVTHNKLTMEAADRMYGVTMPTPGVSRLVSVRFDDADAAAADAAPDGTADVAPAPDPS